MIKPIKASASGIVLMCLSLVLLQQVNTGAGQPQPQAQQRGANDLPLKRTQNATTINVYPSNVKVNATADPLDTSPTITSVHHQVWTSSSSGSLNELSPEVISKLRNDVPFLAAYALRPRLVGAAAGAAAATGASPGHLDKLDESSVASLDSGAGSSPQLARQSLLPRLGDFSELKLETSSLSKSEHRHKRRTTLKRRPGEQDDQGGPLVGGSRRSAEQKRQAKTSGGGRASSKGQRRRSSKKTSGRLVAGRSNQLRQVKVAKNGRFLQKTSDVDDPELPTNKIDNEPNTEGEVKGGGKSPANKRPFYAGKTDADDRQAPATTTTTANPEATGGNDVEDDDPQAADDEQSEPKRVGDDDVEEEGDTVLVEPKSDGVDDDPPLPMDGEPAGGDNEEPSDMNGPGNGVDDEEEQRGKRVNRQKPNQMPGGGSDSTGQSTAGGGGIGATTGAGGSGSNAGGDSGRPRQGSEVEFAADDGDDDQDDKDERKMVDSKKGDDGSSQLPKQSGSGGRDNETDFGRRQKPQRPNDDGSDNDDDLDDKDKPRVGGRGKENKPNSRSNDDGDDDLDYRDELEDQARRKGARPGGNSGDKTDAKGADGGGVDEVDDADDRPRKGAKGAKDGDRKTTDDDCAHDDGSYKHHDEKYHDDHHQAIDWLRGSIPGEPGEDYPILSRVNSTNFQCHQQKYPGYYADVDTRCQVFHICQADGRQDSFLCPNGTIFSQKTLVCVWWNGFDCEDAPKLYHLNALLYKKRPADDVGSPIESPQSAALPDDNDSGTSLRPHGGSTKQTTYLKPKGMMNVAGDSRAFDGASADGNEDMSIDSLIRAMKRRPAKGMDAELSPDDEATIQRKSTGSIEDSAYQPSSSRLRAKSTPRRKRRASTRQAPPKLKSRRVSRNSRRRKLRHGIKPKRRA